MDLRSAIADERREVAGMLETFSTEQWDHPSLCEGWTNRHVAAHLTMGVTASLPQVFVGMVLAGFNFNKVADRFAKRQCEKTTSELVNILRTNADHKFKPPGADYDAPLTDLIVHGIDIRRPLGIEREIPADRWRVVLDLLAQPKSQKFFGSTLPSLKLTATDIGWTSGSGDKSITGTAEDLALLLANRRVDPTRYGGDGVGLLRAS